MRDFCYIFKLEPEPSTLGIGFTVVQGLKEKLETSVTPKHVARLSLLMCITH